MMEKTIKQLNATERRDTAGSVIGLVSKWFFYAVLVIYCLSLLVPLIWMIFTAFKGYTEYYENMFLWPKKWIFENFPSAFEKLKIQAPVYKGDRQVATIEYGIFNMISTSLIWSLSTASIHVLCTALVAYVMARYEFFGRKFLYTLGIFIMITPIIGNTPSMMIVRKSLGIYNNMFLTILTQNSTCFSGLHFLILYGAFGSLPKSYSEAAEVDGAGHYTILLKIMLPMMLPTCAVIFVLSFLTHWNEYGTFLIWLPSYANLAFGMYQFQQDAAYYGANINEIMAGFCLAIIPSATLYIASQKVVMSKFTVGGLKG